MAALVEVDRFRFDRHSGPAQAGLRLYHPEVVKDEASKTVYIRVFSEVL